MLCQRTSTINHRENERKLKLQLRTEHSDVSLAAVCWPVRVRPARLAAVGALVRERHTLQRERVHRHVGACAQRTQTVGARTCSVFTRERTRVGASACATEAGV